MGGFVARQPLKLVYPDMRVMRLLEAAEDVTPEILAAVEETVEWFLDGPMPLEDFIDRLCDTHGGQEWDIERLSTPAVNRIMRHARKVKRESA